MRKYGDYTKKDSAFVQNEPKSKSKEVVRGGRSYSIVFARGLVTRFATSLLNLFGQQAKAKHLFQAKKRRIFRKIRTIVRGAKEGGKVLDSQFWQEKLLKGHPSILDTAQLFDTWKKSDTALSFEDWIQEKGYGPLSEVQYLSSEERREYEISIQNGKLYRHGKPYNTEMEETGFSGPGFAIFVISPNYQIYAGSHEIGKFHHSSFLAGDAVLAAGEIKTDETGALEIISTKSGHYKPGKEQMVNVLKILQESGVEISGIEVHLITAEGTLIFHDAQNFLNDPKALPIGFGELMLDRRENGKIHKIYPQDSSLSRASFIEDLQKLQAYEGFPTNALFFDGKFEYIATQYLSEEQPSPERWAGGEFVKNAKGKIIEMRVMDSEVSDFENLRILESLQRIGVDLKGIRLYLSPGKPPVEAKDYLEEVRGRLFPSSDL